MAKRSRFHGLMVVMLLDSTKCVALVFDNLTVFGHF